MTAAKFDAEGTIDVGGSRAMSFRSQYNEGDIYDKVSLFYGNEHFNEHAEMAARALDLTVAIKSVMVEED